MENKKKVAFCGVWHVHAHDYYKKANELAEIVGVWEKDPVRRSEFCKQYGLHEFKTLDELLASDADGVIVTSASCDHAEHMIKIANAKKDIFTEKVLALTTEDCLKVKEAVERNGVQFVISLFWKYNPRVKTVKKIIDSGELGRINYLRFHNSHSGETAHWLPEHFYNKEECGGGALVDLGAHGMYITEWILGMPVSCKTYLGHCYPNEVEDNAVAVMGFESGAVAVNETSFVSMCCPEVLEIGGERGYVYFRGTGDVIKATLDTEKKSVSEPICEADPLPVVQFLTNNVLPGCGIEEGIRLTKMMELASGRK